jgi:hypothetical protein
MSCAPPGSCRGASGGGAGGEVRVRAGASTRGPPRRPRARRRACRRIGVAGLQLDVAVRGGHGRDASGRRSRRRPPAGRVRPHGGAHRRRPPAAGAPRRGPALGRHEPGAVPPRARRGGRRSSPTRPPGAWTARTSTCSRRWSPPPRSGRPRRSRSWRSCARGSGWSTGSCAWSPRRRSGIWACAATRTRSSPRPTTSRCPTCSGTPRRSWWIPCWPRAARPSPR